jgi:hypothetical protein
MQAQIRTKLALTAVSAAALAGVVLALASSCGRTSPAQVEPRATTTQPRARFLAASDVAGHWQWSHLDDSDGVRRVESEHWQLELDIDTLTGHYDRTVTFLSLDGRPFDCSQTLSYRLTTHYTIIGTADTRHFELSERDYQVTPSPCERGFRRLGSYTGTLVSDTIELDWGAGHKQTLVRGEAPPTAERPTLVAGPWRWRNRQASVAGHEVRVESEDWELVEGEYGSVTGTYLRTVTVFDDEGRSYACSGDSHYQYRDRYTVVGARSGTQLTLAETEVAAAEHPCLTQHQRHLDAASGRVDPEYLSLVWRGRHTQVLHRPTLAGTERAQR